MREAPFGRISTRAGVGPHGTGGGVRAATRPPTSCATRRTRSAACTRPEELAAVVRLAHDLPGPDHQRRDPCAGRAARARPSRHCSACRAPPNRRIRGLRQQGVEPGRPQVRSIVTGLAGDAGGRDRRPPDTRWRVGHFGVIATIAAFTDGGPGWTRSSPRSTSAAPSSVAADRATAGCPWGPPEATFLAWLDCRAIGSGSRAARPVPRAGACRARARSEFGAAGAGWVQAQLRYQPGDPRCGRDPDGDGDRLRAASARAGSGLRPGHLHPHPQQAYGPAGVEFRGETQRRRRDDLGLGCRRRQRQAARVREERRVADLDRHPDRRPALGEQVMASPAGPVAVPPPRSATRRSGSAGTSSPDPSLGRCMACCRPASGRLPGRAGGTRGPWSAPAPPRGGGGRPGRAPRTV